MEPRALKGEVKIHLFSGEAPWIKSVKKLFLKLKEEQVGFDIASTSLKGTQLITKFKSINDRTHAEKWIGAEVFISEEHLQTKPGENFYLREVLGFKVLDHGIEVGTVIEFESNGAQDLLVIESKDKTKILIPLIKEFIIKIDNASKVITMDLPPGLLEVNTSEV
jgi:16S rRNA processing protein RimM